jgi:predicted N-acetyltransferase YhbS
MLPGAFPLARFQRSNIVIIRQETPQDYSRIYDLVKVAFQTAKVTNGQEQDFVERLRNSRDYIPELALVAEQDGDLSGHIMLTRTYITHRDDKVEALFLGPISVVLEYRNQGIGSALMNESLRLAKAMGYKSVFLVGDPAYYHRFGFQPTAKFGIKEMEPIPDEYVMVCVLVDNALAGITGTVRLG